MSSSPCPQAFQEMMQGILTAFHHDSSMRQRGHQLGSSVSDVCDLALLARFAGLRINTAKRKILLYARLIPLFFHALQALDNAVQNYSSRENSMVASVSRRWYAKNDKSELTNENGIVRADD